MARLGGAPGVLRAVLAAALVSLSPGLDAQRAFAQVVSGASGRAAPVPIPAAVGSRAPVASLQSPAPSLSLSAPVVLLSAGLSERASAKQARMTRVAGELLATPKHQGADGEAKAQARYGEAAEEHASAFRGIIGLNTTFDSVQEFLQTLCTELVVLGVGLFCLIRFGTPSIGQIMALRGYTKDLRGALDGLLGLYTDGKDAEGATRRVMQLLRMKPEEPAAAR